MSATRAGGALSWAWGVAVAVAGAAPGAAQYQAVVLPMPSGYPWSVGTGATAGVLAGSSVSPGGGTGTNDRALMWIGGTVTDVTPTGFSAARINNSRDGQHVGATGGFAPRAFLWTNGGGRIPLHPSEGYSESDALGVGGGRQCGYGRLDAHCDGCGRFVYQHAGMWSGSAESFARLHAPEYYNTAANDTTGEQTVGWGLHAIGAGEMHALLWEGGSVVSLHPTGRGYSGSAATCVGSGRQGGWGVAPDGWDHALLWSGTAATAIDLHPAVLFGPVSASMVSSVGAGVQVGTVRRCRCGRCAGGAQPRPWSIFTFSCRPVSETGTPSRAMSTPGARSSARARRMRPGRGGR